ncbi:hypothetical protein LCGC14_0972560 [marine sediment metagenome]|uniref:Uncharacterized protein n=1 Tax=marine sediment metagenome TaxID=412755 RepID=A0A0F9QUE9_9ZZZZ
MSIPKTSRPRSLKSDIDRMFSILDEVSLAHHDKKYKRCLHKLYELSVLTSEYDKKGES